MSPRTRQNTVLSISLLGAVLSLVLLMQHYHQQYAASLISAVCGGAKTGGCVAVDISPYSSILHVPVAALGMFFYLSIGFVVAISAFTEETLQHAIRRIVFFVLCLGTLADLALGAVQVFAVGQLCILCLLTYVVTIALLVLLASYRSAGEVGGTEIFTKNREGKLALVSIGIGVCMLASLIAAYNYGLEGDDPLQLNGRLVEMEYDAYLRSEVAQINTSGLPTIGSSSAQIKVVVISDFLCPWCRQLAQDIQQHIGQWKNEVAFYYINYPLDPMCNEFEKSNIHPGSCWAAQGSVCAGEQGRFWEYHDMLFSKGYNRALPGDILRIATDLNLDTAAFKDCFVDPLLRHKLVLQMDEAHDLGTTSTPRVYINGRLLPKLSDFNMILGREAKELGLPALAGIND